MANLFSLPAELIQSFDDHTRLKLSMTCKHLYSLIPEYKDHLTYPDYIAALERRDFMYLYRHKDTPSCYMKEPLNLPKDHLFVKYLGWFKYVAAHYIPSSDDILCAYEFSPAMDKVLDTYSVNRIAHLIGETSTIGIGLVVRAIKTNHPKTQKLVDIVLNKCDSTTVENVQHHLIKHGVTHREEDKIRTYLDLYAYGRICIEQALVDKDSFALAVMSRDYPDIVLEYVFSLNDRLKVYNMLYIMAYLESGVVPKYIMKVSSIYPNLMNVLKQYPTKDIVDALSCRGDQYILQLLNAMICGDPRITNYVIENYGRRLSDKLDMFKDSVFAIRLMDHIVDMDIDYALRILEKHSSSVVFRYRVYDKLFSILDPLKLPNTISNNIKSILTEYFLIRGNYDAFAHFF